jgi:hypothetical protein
MFSRDVLKLPFGDNIYGRLQSKVHWNCESVKRVGDPIELVISKVRKTQHQNPEFGHTETQKIINFGGKPSFILSFLFSWAPPLLAATYIFTAPNCTTTIISLEPYALHAGHHQHFILRFIKMSFTLWTPLKEGIGGERRPKDRVKTGLLYGHNSNLCNPTNTYFCNICAKQLTQTQHPKIHSNLFFMSSWPSEHLK